MHFMFSRVGRTVAARASRSILNSSIQKASWSNIRSVVSKPDFSGFKAESWMIAVAAASITALTIDKMSKNEKTKEEAKVLLRDFERQLCEIAKGNTLPISIRFAHLSQIMPADASQLLYSNPKLLVSYEIALKELVNLREDVNTRGDEDIAKGRLLNQIKLIQSILQALQSNTKNPQSPAREELEHVLSLMQSELKKPNLDAQYRQFLEKYLPSLINQLAILYWLSGGKANHKKSLECFGMLLPEIAKMIDSSREGVSVSLPAYNRVVIVANATRLLHDYAKNFSLEDAQALIAEALRLLEKSKQEEDPTNSCEFYFAQKGLLYKALGDLSSNDSNKREQYYKEAYQAYRHGLLINSKDPLLNFYMAVLMRTAVIAETSSFSCSLDEALNHLRVSTEGQGWYYPFGLLYLGTLNAECGKYFEAKIAIDKAETIWASNKNLSGIDLCNGARIYIDRLAADKVTISQSPNTFFKTYAKECEKFDLMQYRALSNSK